MAGALNARSSVSQVSGQATAHRHPPVSLSDPDRQSRTEGFSAVQIGEFTPDQ